MSYEPGYDFKLQVARGLVGGVTGIYKFGAAPFGIQLTATDIWSRADVDCHAAFHGYLVTN